MLWTHQRTGQGVPVLLHPLRRLSSAIQNHDHNAASGVLHIRFAPSGVVRTWLSNERSSEGGSEEQALKPGTRMTIFHEIMISWNYMPPTLP